jgi:hypothetical protein
VLAHTLAAAALLVVSTIVIGTALVLANALAAAELLIIPADRRDDTPSITAPSCAAPGVTAPGIATAATASFINGVVRAIR